MAAGTAWRLRWPGQECYFRRRQPPRRKSALRHSPRPFTQERTARSPFTTPCWKPVILGWLSTSRTSSGIQKAAGSSTSSYQKTAKAIAYHCTGSPPTIGLSALLRVAGWCQQLCSTQGGSTSCLSPRCPPVASDGSSLAAAQGTVAAPSRAAAASNRSTTQRADSKAPPRARRQGGGR
jgi:hypothetical protein